MHKTIVITLLSVVFEFTGSAQANAKNRVHASSGKRGGDGAYEREVAEFNRLTGGSHTAAEAKGHFPLASLRKANRMFRAWHERIAGLEMPPTTCATFVRWECAAGAGLQEFGAPQNRAWNATICRRAQAMARHPNASDAACSRIIELAIVNDRKVMLLNAAQVGADASKLKTSDSEIVHNFIFAVILTTAFDAPGP